MTRTILRWMQARRALVSVAAASLLLIISATSAGAQTQITLGNSALDVSFEATSGTSMNVGLGCPSNGFTGTTCTLSGGANFGSDTGTYTFTTSTASPFTATNTGLTVFQITTPALATSTFSFVGISGSLTGNVTWIDVANGSDKPHFDGLLTSIVATGDLAALFSSQTATFDFGLSSITCVPAALPNPPNSGCNLENLFNPNNVSNNVVATAPISSGQVIPAPEPASMLLFGSGLLACCAFIRRRRSDPTAASA